MNAYISVGALMLVLILMTALNYEFDVLKFIDFISP